MGIASAPQLERETDTEITLGTGKMLVLFFGLVVLCALFFGMGFTMGKNSVKITPELLASPSRERPSAANKMVTPAPATQPPPAAQSPAQQLTPDNSTSNSASAAPAQPAPDQGTPSTAPDQTAGAQAQPQAPPLFNGPGYFVQVAAVTKQEDAEALVEALKSHQYAAMIANNATDKLFHVQIGPFADIKDAEATRAKLVSDGYSPILKR